MSLSLSLSLTGEAFLGKQLESFIGSGLYVETKWQPLPTLRKRRE
jgi:hypothetical protein